MTNEILSSIVGKEGKGGYRCPGKEIAVMKAVIRKDYLSRERYQALGRIQGLAFTCSNKIRRECCCELIF
ncbi:MAG: hypothetical protein ACI4ED_06335 [Suilimivivens sp.]